MPHPSVSIYEIHVLAWRRRVRVAVDEGLEAAALAVHDVERVWVIRVMGGVRVCRIGGGFGGAGADPGTKLRGGKKIWPYL